MLMTVGGTEGFWKTVSGVVTKGTWGRESMEWWWSNGYVFTVRVCIPGG